MQIVRRAYAYAYVEFYAHERKVVLRRTSNVVGGRISSRDRGVGRFVPRVPRLLRRKNAAPTLVGAEPQVPKLIISTRAARDR